MKIYYSASQNGFFHDDIHETTPEDAVEITQERYDELKAAELAGKEIRPKGKQPAAYAREVEKSDPLVMRAAAYRAESDPLYMEWQFEQTAEAEKAWRDKVMEIKARYPLPE